ncbi:MAG: leucyl aminopeptidase [Pseudomonadota bacterium]
MTPPLSFEFIETDLDQIEPFEGQIAVFVEPSGKLDQTARRVNRLTKGALERFAESEAFADMSPGDARELAYPAGLAATGVIVAKLERRPEIAQARKAGAAIGKAKGKGALLLLAGNIQKTAAIIEGVVLRAYQYVEMKSGPGEPAEGVTVMCSKPADVSAAAAAPLAVAEGVFFTRDLTNAPANHLTTVAFADALLELREIGLEVEVLDEPELETLGMRTLLSVGQGSSAPSKVVVMQWKGGGDEAPFALVGKGVVFDTGGISLKPAGGMEDMTMDMGGAGVVAGAMKALALRKAGANVVGLVGLVENMPGPDATRPGDVVTSMKGDTVEIINTDAEGRLVLADVLWYTQERFKPCGMINLATLTGAIIIGLGHEMAGVFSNSDQLSERFLTAAGEEGEGAWRMPLAPAYDKQLKSQIADMKNVGGRPAGSITAGQFLQRFVLDETPWAHLDIAGVASVKSETSFAPKGATGWGVRALNRLIADHYESA